MKNPHCKPRPPPTQGLVTRERGDSSTLESFKLPYCHSGPGPEGCPDLLSAVQRLRPTVLIGLSTAEAPPFKFTPEVLRVSSAGCGSELGRGRTTEGLSKEGAGALMGGSRAREVAADTLRGVGAFFHQSPLSTLGRHNGPHNLTKQFRARRTLFFSADIPMRCESGHARRSPRPQAMATNAKHPLVFPLSAGSPECTAAEAYEHTEGRALVATEQRVGGG